MPLLPRSQISTLRSALSRQKKTISPPALNSYKINTKTLEQKIKQIQRLKTSLQFQISQYKTAESVLHQQILKLTSQNKLQNIHHNNRLLSKIKLLQTRFNNSQTRSQITPPSQSSEKINIYQKHSNSEIVFLQNKIIKLNSELDKMTEQITQLTKYKEMYQIEVQNKNNILNFYQNKISFLEKNKASLVSQYQEKISQLQNLLQTNSFLMKTSNFSFAPNSMTTNEKSRQRRTRCDSEAIQNDGKISTFASERDIFTKRKETLLRKSNSSKNLQFSNSSKKNQSRQFSKRFLQFQKQKTSKLTKPSSFNDCQSQSKENILPLAREKNKKSNKKIPTTSLSSKKQKNTYSRKTLKLKPNVYQASSPKRIRIDDDFLMFIRQILLNLKSQNIKSQNLKSFSSVQRFMDNENPSMIETLSFVQSIPLGPLKMEKKKVQGCLQKIKRHIERKYLKWSGVLFVDILIDQIQDLQIANQVNSDGQFQIFGVMSSCYYEVERST